MKKRQTLTLSLFMSGVALLASAKAYAFADDDARRAILDLREQVKMLTAQVQQLESSLSVLQSGQVALLDKFGQYDVRQRNLTGKVEELQNQSRRMDGDLKKIYTNLDERMMKLEPTEVSINGETVLVGAQEHLAYQRIEGLVNQARAKDAERAIEAFQKDFPSSVYRAQVSYWLATLHFQAGQYRQVIQDANKLIRDDPRSALVPDAMLMVASAQASLNSFKAAQATLKKVMQRYPKSEQAKTAQERLKLFTSKK